MQELHQGMEEQVFDLIFKSELRILHILQRIS